MIQGLVTAIETNGRIRLQRPSDVYPHDLSWERVLVSPRKHLRVLSKDSVVFFPWKP